MTAKIKTRSNKSGHRSSHKPKGISDKAFRKVYWPYIPVVLIIGVLLSISSQVGAVSTFLQHPGGKVLAYATSMSSGGLLSSTNGARSQNGVKSLKINSKLAAAAQAKANDMANRNYWSHNTPEGKTPWTFVVAKGYSYQKLGENLAAGFSNEQATVNGWMGSAPHKENLLDSAFSEVGFGWANNANYTSAGGGPMTIAVAFYGKPQVLSAQTSNSSSSKSAKATSPSPSPASSAKKAASPPPPAQKVEEKAPPPANTETATPSNELAAKSSRAQVAFASLPIVRFATTLAMLGAVAAILVWLSRHVIAIHRAIKSSEKFVIRHPLFDLCLLIIAALSYLLTQTAGFIQ